MTFYFDVPVSDTIQKVWISLPLGSGSKVWHININNYFCGSVTKRDGKWVQLHINRHEFTLDDIDAIGERIDEFCSNIKA